MSVNESKTRWVSPQWAKWHKSGALGSMEAAELRSKMKTTVPAQALKGPMTEYHVASTIIGDETNPTAWVSTIDLKKKGLRNYRDFETMVFESKGSGRGRKDSLGLPENLDTPMDSPLGRSREMHARSRAVALRNHQRAVAATAAVFGTQRA